MGPYAMEAVGFLKPSDDARESLDTLVACNKATIHGSNQSCYAKSTAARGNHILVVLGILAVEVNALACETRVRFCAIPHVVEVYLLDVVKHRVITGKRCWALSFGRLWLVGNGFGRALAACGRQSNAQCTMHNT